MSGAQVAPQAHIPPVPPAKAGGNGRIGPVAAEAIARDERPSDPGIPTPVPKGPPPLPIAVTFPEVRIPEERIPAKGSQPARVIPEIIIPAETFEPQTPDQWRTQRQLYVDELATGVDKARAIRLRSMIDAINQALVGR